LSPSSSRAPCYSWTSALEDESDTLFRNIGNDLRRDAASYPGKNLNPLSPELNPICYLLALLAHDFLHVSRIRVKLLTLKLLMFYIYIYIYIYIYKYMNDISSLRVKQEYNCIYIDKPYIHRFSFPGVKRPGRGVDPPPN
jgi:hypothetical protein